MAANLLPVPSAVRVAPAWRFLTLHAETVILNFLSIINYLGISKEEIVKIVIHPASWLAVYVMLSVFTYSQL